MRNYDGYEYTSNWTRYKRGVNEYMAAASCLVLGDIHAADNNGDSGKESEDNSERRATDDSDLIPVLDDHDEQERELVE